jgi:hypothetical protein
VKLNKTEIKLLHKAAEINIGTESHTGDWMLREEDNVIITIWSQVFRENKVQQTQTTIKTTYNLEGDMSLIKELL